MSAVNTDDVIRVAISVCLALAAACASPEEPAPPEPDMPMPAIPWAPRGYVCYRTPVAPVIDGKLDEEEWRAAPATAAFVDIEGDLRPRPRLATRARLLWDDRFLYVGAAMNDPDVSGFLEERDAVIYHDNDFEFFLDPDGDCRDYFEIEINARGTVWDLLLRRTYRDGGPAEHGWNSPGLRTGVHVDGTLNDPSDRDGGWSVEMAIPWIDLAQYAGRPAPPAPGDRWRMNMSRVQWRYDTAGGGYEKLRDGTTGMPLPENNWVWSPQGLVAMHYPEMWGFLQFSGVGVGTAVEALLPPTESERTGWEALRRRAERRR